jgi:AF1548-like, C-terminal/Restriction endonuclease
MPLKIIKASGQPEEFIIEKLVDSLIRSGASEDMAWDIARKVERQVTHGSHTKHIFRMAKRLLRQYSRVSDMRYSIKKAIYSLGPAGYQFEKYFARILRTYGYSVEVNRIIKGYCVTHEVDVFAGKDDRWSVIECKYHSNGGIPADVKIALYVHSRYADIKKAYDFMPEKNVTIQQGWLVTNTRCSSDAIKYAECTGMKIVSWKYPEKESLEKMIENNRLYPVTILSSVTRNSVEALFRNGIILAMDIADMEEETFMKKSGLDKGLAKILKREADTLCSHP